MTEPQQLRPGFRALYGDEPRVFRAPGRVNIIGEHVDYNDGMVMPAAIDLSTWVAVSPRNDRKLVVRSQDLDGVVELNLDLQRPKAAGDWSDYVYGVALEIDRRGQRLPGANVLVASEVPIGAGLSSSAALEVASALAFADLADVELSPEETARLCLRAESEFVGARCGIMDQFIACFGRPDQAIVLDCRDLNFRFVSLPSTVRLVLANTMVRHDLTAGKYNKRRAECEQALERLKRGQPGIESLRDVTAEAVEAASDVLTRTQLRRCRHVASENQRVLKAEKALAEEDPVALGHILSKAHASLRDDYEVSCRELDLMAELAERTPGVFGARMMGGGFGGCVIALVEAGEAEAFAGRVGRRYKEETDVDAWFHVCTLSGAAEAVDPVPASVS